MELAIPLLSLRPERVREQRELLPRVGSRGGPQGAVGGAAVHLRRDHIRRAHHRQLGPPAVCRLPRRVPLRGAARAGGGRATRLLALRVAAAVARAQSLPRLRRGAPRGGRDACGIRVAPQLGGDRAHAPHGHALRRDRRAAAARLDRQRRHEPAGEGQAPTRRCPRATACALRHDRRRGAHARRGWRVALLQRVVAGVRADERAAPRDAPLARRARPGA
mmetsp:Transcript_22863/g.57046  ORF Transcript_22863/g.57046 Transcript_22863/m.57046 type:complete len:220 (+) Transcript_22863:12148-12807(+)